VSDEGISIDMSSDGELVVVAVSGEIDLVTVPHLQAVLDSIDSGRAVIVDCARVQFMDSTGLQLFVTQLQRLNATGGSLLLRNTSFPVRHIVEVTGLIELLEPDGE
jgi:anti-sigma B factor antagonist